MRKRCPRDQVRDSLERDTRFCTNCAEWHVKCLQDILEGAASKNDFTPSADTQGFIARAL